MPKKNLLLFIVVTAFLIGGLWLVQINWLQKPDEADQTAQTKDKKETSKAKESPKEKPPEKEPEKKPEPEPEKKQPKEEKGPKTPEEPARDIVLGDPDNSGFYIL